jgi:multiple sugar transport system substrate-binding protein
MMNIEKVFYIIIGTILAAVLIFFTFVFSPSGEDTRSKSKYKSIYFVDHISSAHQKVIDRFNQKYKGSIKVETINLSFNKFSTNERKELLARYLRSKNNRIDIFSVDQIWVPRFARWAVPLQNFLDSTEISNIIPNALQTCHYKDTLVAVPLYIDIAVMFYREDLLKKLTNYSKIVDELNHSVTWGKFIDLHQKNNEVKNPFYTFQADDYEGLVCSFAEIMANQNKSIIDKNGKILVNSPESRTALKLLVDLVNAYGVSPKEVTHLKENESFRLFGERNGIFLRAWSSMFDDKVEYLTEAARSKLRMTLLPHLENTKPTAVYGGWNLMVSKFSERIPEVIKFAKFLISEESQRIMYEEGGYLPTNKKLYDDTDFVARHKEIIFFKELYKIGVHRPFIEGYTNFSDILSYYINKAIKGEISVDKALEQAELKINEKAILVK